MGHHIVLRNVQIQTQYRQCDKATQYTTTIYSFAQRISNRTTASRLTTCCHPAPDTESQVILRNEFSLHVRNTTAEIILHIFIAIYRGKLFIGLVS